VVGDSKQLLGATIRTAHDGAFQCNPALSTSTLLIGKGCKTVFSPTVATTTSQCNERGIQSGQILRMDLRPHLRKCLWYIRAIAVNATIPGVIVEAAGFQVKAPGT